MMHLGTLSGTGNVRGGGVFCGQIEYSINIWSDQNGNRTAIGHAQGDYRVLSAIYQYKGTATLELANKRGEVKILMTNVDASGAVIKVTGRLPGF